MSRIPLDEEQNTESRDYQVRDILSEYWDHAVKEAQPVPSSRRSLSRASMDALRAAEEPEDAVRIYEPRRDRADSQERLAARWGEVNRENGQPEEPEPQEQAPVSEAMPGKASRFNLQGLADSFFSRFRSGKRPSRSVLDKAKTPEPEDLPSFDELLWGKKAKPVRIADEDEAPPAPTAAPAAVGQVPSPAPATEVEIHIPESELTGISVDAILAEYWGGLEDATTPVEPQPLPRRRQRPSPPPAAEESRSAFRDKAPSGGKRISAAGLLGSLTGKRAAPVRETAPAPAAKAASRPAEAPTRPLFPEDAAPITPPASRSAPKPPVEEDVLNMSVSDILSEFWADYTEPEEQPAPRADAPRSRREAARMREEASSVPPTDAAPSAADSKSASSSRSKQKDRSRDRRSPSRSGSAIPQPVRPPRPEKRDRRGKLSFPPVGEEPSDPMSEPPAPLDPSETAEAFGFLRRPRQEVSSPVDREIKSGSPAQEAPPVSEASRSPSPRRREIIAEDVECP